MDIKDPSAPTWRVLLHLALFVLFVGYTLWNLWHGEWSQAAVALLFAVWIDLTDSIDGHFGDIRRRETRRAGLYR